MLHFEHDSRDDLAPRDYAYTPSVKEGIRRERAQKIHRDPAQQGLVPAGSLPPAANRVDEYGIPDDPFHPPEETQRPRRSRAARNAEREQAEAAAQAKPQAPVVQPQAPVVQPQAPAVQPRAVQTAAPVRPMTGARTAMPAAAQFDRPASPEIPEWLKVAQQNQPPLQPRPQAPRVQAAPRQQENGPLDPLGRPMRRAQRSAAYEQAGYPQELLDAQRELEQQSAATPVRRRHGAQYAVKPTYEPAPTPAPRQRMPEPVRPAQTPQPAPTQEAVMSRAYHRPKREEPESYRVEDDEIDERALPRVRIPWMGILAFLAVLAAVVLWIMQTNYRTQTQAVLDERAAREAAILEAHPLKYQSIISDKANKYNLHPAFVAAIMLNESSFRPDATSSVEARGLMQLMDDTAGWIYEKMDVTAYAYDFDRLYEPEINAEYGCWYLNYLSELFYGDPILVAAAFHAGQGEVRNWLNDSSYSKDGRSIRLEDMIEGPTKRYVTRVLNDFAAYKRLYFGG